MRLPPCACNTLALSAHHAHARRGGKIFLSQFSSSYTPSEERWKQAGPRHLSLPKQNSKSCRNAGWQEISLFCEAYTKTRSKRITLCPTGGADLGVHTNVYIHQPPDMHTNTHRHTNNAFTDSCLSLQFSHTQANRHKYRLQPPQSQATLQIGKWLLQD